MRDNLWTEEEAAFIRAAWDRGLTSSQIADALFAEIKTRRTRNSIIGKVHRLNLPPRKSPIEINANTQRRVRRNFDYQRLLTHPNEDILKWEND